MNRKNGPDITLGAWLRQRILSVASSARRVLSSSRPLPRADHGAPEAGSDEPFDPDYYLRSYPDLAKAGVDPWRHYQDFGRAEGRSGSPPVLAIAEHPERFVAGREVVLVVSHGASRSGAPILAWNICKHLGQHYNVVALLLGSGEIEGAFHSACATVVGPVSVSDHGREPLQWIVHSLCKRFKPRFAIINSLASRGVLRPLASAYVPSVLLIHEFYRYLCTPDELIDAMALAGRTVFSAELVRAHSDIERTHTAINGALVAPQGKSEIPEAEGGAEAMTDGPVRLRASGKPFVVLGAGTVEYRKGVDLFISTATEVQRQRPGADIVMLWVGASEAQNRSYIDFLELQLAQAGLGDRFQLAAPTSQLEALYREVDLFFVSSRLDPLPNVALDALTAGVPTLCFDGASGLAENLRCDEQCARLVVPYLAVHTAAARILDVFDDRALHRDLSMRSRALADQRFDMSRYVARLAQEALALEAVVAQERQDVAALENDATFDEAYYLLPRSARSRADAIREYVKFSQGQIYARKAIPGFLPHVYAQAHDLGPTQINPLVHFIAAGKPQGPWQETLIDVSSPSSASIEGLRVAVHIHAFYADMALGIVDRLAANGFRCDLLISVSTNEVARQLRADLSASALGEVVIRQVENRGRDIAPLFLTFGDFLGDYDVVGHFHTKKSVHVQQATLVPDWVNFLMQNLLGEAQMQSARRILSEFVADPVLGLVFADDPNSLGWDKNRAFAEALAARMGIATLPSQFFSFPVGTMFWARPRALQPLLDLHFTPDDFPEEPLPIDGSMLHAMERLFPTVARHAGYGVAVTRVPGLTR